MVSVHLDHDLAIVSDEKFNLFTDHHRFDRKHIARWSAFYKQHLVDSTNVEDDNLLQDYFLNCLTGFLRTEVVDEFYSLPAIEQSAASLVYLALTKLESNLCDCIPTRQGSIACFKISNISNENVSLASSWLKAIIKTLKATNSIPSQSIGHILSGMATSQSKKFNSFVSILMISDPKRTRVSADCVSAVLNKCCVKYRELLQAGHWPMTQSK
jgi:hypothetical protein